MAEKKKLFEQLYILKHLGKWTILVIPVSLLVGSLVAFFLWLLDLATASHWQNEWLLFFLPIAGILIHFLYKFSGKNAEAGNNLIMDEIHKPGGGVPARMTPLVIFSTIITHLFGGSAGREGTAVQIGGSMANVLAKLFKLSKEDIKILLMTGIAAGFGAVFGTPIAGAIFALEVLAIGRIKYDALIPCLIASIFADITCSAWGIQHIHYHIDFITQPSVWLSFLHIDVTLLLKVLIAGIAFGLVSYLYAETSHTIKNYANKYISKKWLIPALGGTAIIILTYILGTKAYLGLGVYSKDLNGISIMSAFHEGSVTNWSWLWKLVFTAITLSTGFKGGEVTPLFFIGATLGNTLAILLGAPVDLFAGIGFIAVFAGATNTPLACTLMGVELFGANNIVYYAIACFIAYYFSGHSGIYNSQRVAVSKINLQEIEGDEQTLKQIREKRIKK